MVVGNWSSHLNQASGMSVCVVFPRIVTIQTYRHACVSGFGTSSGTLKRCMRSLRNVTQRVDGYWVLKHSFPFPCTTFSPKQRNVTPITSAIKLTTGLAASTLENLWKKPAKKLHNAHAAFTVGDKSHYCHYLKQFFILRNDGLLHFIPTNDGLLNFIPTNDGLLHFRFLIVCTD